MSAIVGRGGDELPRIAALGRSARSDLETVMVRWQWKPGTLGRDGRQIWSAALGLLVLNLGLAGCAAQATRAGHADKAADTEQGEQLVRQFEARLDAALTLMERLRAGEVIDDDALRAARDALREPAQTCLSLPACDHSRVLSGYERLAGEGLAIHSDSSEELTEADLADAQTPADNASESPLLNDLPEAQRSISLLNGRELRDLIELNTPVKAAMVEWLTWMRPNLITAYENYQYLRYLMWPEYEKAGLPEALLFGLLAKESGGRVHAVSRAGASGPLQFMYQTGLGYGLGRVDGFDTRFDPQLSARASVAYLNDRFAELNHNLELALAAYNGGEGRIRRLYAGSGGKPYWDRRIRGQLPAETQDYVPMVLAAAWLFLHPEEAGLVFPTIDATPATLVLQQPTSLNELTMCLGQGDTREGWFRVLRNLNPRLQPHAPLAAGTTLQAPRRLVDDYQRWCVAGERLQLAQQLAAASKPTVPPVGAVASAYRVRKGDSLHGIARRYGCTVGTLANANGIRAPKYLIRPGQTLQLQSCSRS